MGVFGKDEFDGLRFAWWHGASTPTAHGGTRLVDLQQSTRPIADTHAAVRREQATFAREIADFHKVFYASHQTHGMTFYEGVPLLKSPMDLWVYQEILWDLQPTLIIETGTAYGGSALYYARQLDRVAEKDPGNSHNVLSIDVDPSAHLPQHPRVSYVRGSSIGPDMIAAVRSVARTHPRVMVTLDSDHSMAHVLAELDAYAPLVSPGQFLVVEDTNINGRPVEIDWKGGPGPGPAVDEWLPRHPEFEREIMAERYLLTMHTWLRRRTDA